MVETITKQWQGKVALALFILFSVWWALLQTPYGKNPLFNELFGGLYGLIAVWGAVWGVITAKHWGFWKSIMGKAILLLSLGLFLQEFGQLVYFYYVFFAHIEVPYPSIGDVGFFGSIPFYIGGVYYLAKASGIRFGLRSVLSKLQVVLIPLVLLIFSYYLFLREYAFDWSNPLVVFLDFGYPMGQAMYISLALLTYTLSRGILGGVMRGKILFILFALFMQYLSDYTFLYQVSRGLWVAHGFNDYMYVFSYFLMTFGLLQLRSVLFNIKDK